MRNLTFVLLAGTALSLSASQVPAQTPASVVERLDPALDALVGTDTKVEKIYEEDQFFEGPVWHHGAGGNFLTFSVHVYRRCLEGQGQEQRHRAATQRQGLCPSRAQWRDVG